MDFHHGGRVEDDGICHARDCGVPCAAGSRQSRSSFRVTARFEGRDGQHRIAGRGSPGFFRAIGLRLEAGRAFADADLPAQAGAQDGVVVVNAAFARQFFQGRNPLGQHLTNDKKHVYEIVGVVADYRAMGAENGARATIFWPDLRLAHATLLVRAAARPEALAAALRDAVWTVDRGLPATEVKPMGELPGNVRDAV